MPGIPSVRRDSEQPLRETQPEERQERRGRLKIFLGYAAGVGKTYHTLEEAQELRRQGADIVIGYFESHGRKDTIARTEGLEIIPRRKVQYRGVEFEEMDTEAIVRRHPQVCVVDEFAHTNVPGSERPKRWEDVEVLLDAGIDVLTNMNVQHLESLNDQVWQVSGVRVRETVPDWVIKQADEVVMIDLTPRALLNRLQRGVVYAPDKARRATENFFKEPTLAALREMALRQTAHEVDARQVVPEEFEILQSGPGRSDEVPPSAEAKRTERVLIDVTADPSAAALIRRGRRVADYLKAECFAVSVQSDDDARSVPVPEREALEKHLNFARNLQIETRVLQGRNVAETLVDFARRHGITQIFLARPRQKSRPLAFGRNLVHEVVRLASDMQVIIVAERLRDQTATQRLDPERLLRQVQAEEESGERGRLKIFLGYAGGVGKSFRMLDEGRRRQQRGQDVVVGAIQPITSPEVQALVAKMQVIPPKVVDGVPVMNVEAILQRHPQVCLVDGLAYDNPPGSRHAKRWEDVEELLEAGISVIASVNLQYIEEHREQVERITGKQVSQTIPQGFLSTADEIEVVDAPPEMCLERASETVDKVGADEAPSLRQQQLSELREIALVLAADVVDRQLETYLERYGIQPVWGTQERILVSITSHDSAVKMIESGRRNADRFHGELFVAHVTRPEFTVEEQTSLEKNLAHARSLDAQIEMLGGEDWVDTIVKFASNRGITQIFVGRDTHESWWDRIFSSPIDRLIRAADCIDVRIFPSLRDSKNR